MKKLILVMLIIAMMLVSGACGKAGEKYADYGMKTLMETSTEDWVGVIEKDCFLRDLGRPYGTVKETLDKDEKEMIWTLTFEIDEDITQAIVDGYAKSVWDACVAADGGRMHSCNGYLYDEAWDAKRRQAPLDYYIWYYSVNHKEYRVGIYPSNLEDGIPGGIVLKIERWHYKK